MLPGKGMDEPSGGRRGSVLCLDPDPAQLEITRTFLEKNGFKCIAFTRPGDAFEAVASLTPDVILLEIKFADIEGIDVIRAFRKLNPDPVLIILTSQEERRKGRDRRLGQIFEFSTKPIRPPELLGHLIKGIAFSREKAAVTRFTQESVERIRNKLEWMIWKDRQLLGAKQSSEKLLLKNIKHSMSQGFGFGGLLTQIGLLELTAKTENNIVTLNTENFNALLTAADNLRGWFENIDKITALFNMELENAKMREEDLSLTIQESLTAVETLRQINNQTVSCGELKPPGVVICSAKILGMCFREILTNSFKYSPEGSTIHILNYRSSNFLSIAVVNDILPMQGGVTGIPPEMENLLFEPFLRLNNTYDERFRAEELGMGIGLTIVQNALSQYGGAAFVYEVLDHAVDFQPRRRIVAEMMLSLAEPEGK